VRVDIVERLADMIRAASTLRVVGGSDSGPSAFLIAGQMTSLTGCSGESFASILKALGFESLTVRRREIVWPAAPSPAGETPSPGSDESAVTNSDDAFPSAATSADRPSEAVPSSSDDAIAPPAASASALEPKDQPIGYEASPMTDPVTLSVEDSTESLIVPEGDFASPPEPAAATDESAPSPAEEDETLTVWRFARAPAPHHPRPARQARRKFPVPRDQRVQPHDAPKVQAGLAPAARQPADPPVAKEGRDPASEKTPHRAIRRKDWDAKKRHMPEDKQDGRSPSGGRSGGDRKLAIDPMSPFAKLMELRSILESESKKRS
jgi:ATP-dependent RNA helicase SUPV3L1/SUV3